MAEFKMPSLGADMEAGTLIEWRVKPGQSVKRGDIVAVVDTEKAAIDVEIWIDGVVESLLIEPGIRVPVGAVLAIVRVPGEAPGAAPAAPMPAPGAPLRPPAAPAAPPRPAPPSPRPTPAPAAPAPAAPSAPGAAPHRATPLARHIAQDLGVSLDAVTGTGPGGSITRADVEQAAAQQAATAPATAPAAPPGAPAVAARLRVSPRARRRARELGVDLSRAKGTGPDGAITQADVERVAAAPMAPAAAPKAPVAAMTAAERGAAMRRAIAQAMARSKREIPHYYLGLEIDFTRAQVWLELENAKRPIDERLLYSVLLIKAVAIAAREVPEMNGFWIGDRFQPSQRVHIGMAISLRAGGLVAPALHDPDTKSLTEIMGELRDLVLRARAGSLRSSELTDPTLTITNLGEQGVDQVFGIIFPPQVALVGFGRLSARHTIHASLSADHRASDGHRGGVFLAAMDRRLQSPETL